MAGAACRASSTSSRPICANCASTTSKARPACMRLKEELLRRVNVAAAPYRVRDVLLKEMIVQ